MLYLNTATDRPPTPKERVDIMVRNINRLGIPMDYDRLLEYCVHFKFQASLYEERLRSLLGIGTMDVKEGQVKDWIFNNGLERGFPTTPKGDISISVDALQSVIDRNLHPSEVIEVFKIIKEWNFNKAQALLLPNVINSHQPSGVETEDGRRVIFVTPTVTLQNTGRFGMSNPAVMNFPRYMKDLYVAPKGWTLISADSGQIEPKIIYGFYLKDPQINALIKLYKDAYYGVLHYCTMPREDIINGKMDFEPFEINEEKKALRQRLKTYGNGVMYGSTSNPEQDPLKQAYIDRIGQHPLRKSWFNDLESKLMAGQKEFPTLFGTPINVYKSEKYNAARDEKSKLLALEHCIINNPIQGTAADLMGFSLRATDKLLREKAPNSWITKFVHDEGSYCVYNEELEAVYDELKEHTSYCIDDDVIIYNDPHIGNPRTDIAPSI